MNMNNKKEIKEGVEVIIKETNVNSVKSINFGMNTATSGESTFITEPINGMLEGVFIHTEKPIHLRISFDDDDKIVLFDLIEINGSQYLPLRVAGMVNSGENLPNTSEKWPLDGSLMFEINGGFSINVNFSLRWR